MADIINVLSDNIANQIAAGEVIQRPASAVKELLENAVDAGATQIHLIIKDAGKELIRVIDNGKGMSDQDARLCFERHATSKIAKIEDLFSIRTMGFRGEALASIAAVAQVELKTKQAHLETGTLIHIDNSKVQLQEPCSTLNGTSIAVKNLFFNVPARRTFLKSNTTELRHIVDEFTRVAMAFPQVAFKFTNQDSDLYVLESGSLKQRIIALLGNNLQTKLITLKEETPAILIDGFIGTPDAANKSRTNQFFFVNNRYIRSPYLSHALTNAYTQLIPKDTYPSYIIFLDINPEKIDANVHPTKQEIKFDDERMVYAILNSATKKALSQNSIMPSIDFDLDHNISQLSSITQPFTKRDQETSQSSSIYQGFTSSGQAFTMPSSKKISGNWEELYKIEDSLSSTRQAPIKQDWTEESFLQPRLLLPHYIAYPKANGFLLIHVPSARERIYYDQLQKKHSQSSIAAQNLLHPVNIELAPADVILLKNMIPDLLDMGIQIEEFGGNNFIVQALPVDLIDTQVESIIADLIEQVKMSSDEFKIQHREQIIRSIARRKVIYNTDSLSDEMIASLCAELFTTSHPEFTPSGARIFVTITSTEIEKRFIHS
jgi:DNA mismatch repair protein MutL